MSLSTMSLLRFVGKKKKKKANYSSCTFFHLLLVVHIAFISQGECTVTVHYTLQPLHFKSFSYRAILCTGQCKILIILMSCKFQIGIGFSCNASSFFSICEVIEVTEFHKLLVYIYVVSKQLPYTCTNNIFYIYCTQTI